MAWGIWNLFMAVMMFLLVKLIVRKTWAAMIIFSLLGLALFSANLGDPWLFVASMAGYLTVFWFVLIRF